MLIFNLNIKSFYFLYTSTYFIKQLNETSCIYHTKLKEMESKYSQLEKNDARFTFFHKCIQVYDNILLLFIIRKSYLTNKEFFKKHKDEITLREGLEEQF